MMLGSTTYHCTKKEGMLFVFNDVRLYNVPLYEKEGMLFVFNAVRLYNLPLYEKEGMLFVFNPVRLYNLLLYEKRRNAIRLQCCSALQPTTVRKGRNAIRLQCCSALQPTTVREEERSTYVIESVVLFVLGVLRVLSCLGALLLLAHSDCDPVDAHHYLHLLLLDRLRLELELQHKQATIK